MLIWKKPLVMSTWFMNDPFGESFQTQQFLCLLNFQDSTKSPNWMAVDGSTEDLELIYDDELDPGAISSFFIRQSNNDWNAWLPLFISEFSPSSSFNEINMMNCNGEIGFKKKQSHFKTLVTLYISLVYGITAELGFP